MNIKKLSIVLLLSMAPFQAFGVAAAKVIMSKKIAGSAQLFNEVFDVLRVEGSLQATKVSANRLWVDGSGQLNNCTFDFAAIDGSLSAHDVTVAQMLKVDGSLQANTLRSHTLQVDGSGNIVAGVFETVHIDGSLKATNLTTKSLQVDGSTTIIDAHIESGEVDGSFNATNVVIVKECSVNGRVNANETTFGGKLTIVNQGGSHIIGMRYDSVIMVNGKVVHATGARQENVGGKSEPHAFNNCQATDIVIDDSSGPAEVCLTGNTTVNSIIFKSGKGKVTVSEQAKVNKVIGGVVAQ